MIGSGEELELSFDRAWPRHSDELIAADEKVQNRHCCVLMPGAFQHTGSVRESILPNLEHAVCSVLGKDQPTAIVHALPQSKVGGA